MIDKEHGRQLKAFHLKTMPPNTREGMEKYLASGMVKGIGPIYAKRLIARIANTPAGNAYKMAEYNQMLDAAGFGAREIMDVPMSPEQLIVASAKPT